MSEKSVEEELLVVPGNPPPPPLSSFKISKGIKVRGDAIFVIFGGVMFGVLLFVIGIDTSILLAIPLGLLPVILSVSFYFRFLRERPKYYFDFWCDALFDRKLHKKRLMAVRYSWLDQKGDC